jgi:hypothetical protein
MPVVLVRELYKVLPAVEVLKEIGINTPPAVSVHTMEVACRGDDQSLPSS